MADLELILMLNAIRLEIRAGHLCNLMGAFAGTYSDRFTEACEELSALQLKADRAAAEALDEASRGRGAAR